MITEQVRLEAPDNFGISVIVPVLDEAALLPAALARLVPLRAAGHEIIVVDGGSSDASVEYATARTDNVIQAARGRARQMNAGAAVARYPILLFLHADTQLPANAATQVCDAIAGGAGWGRFDVRLSGRHWLLRIVERMMNLRSRLSGIATGDQAMFVTRELFGVVGGFPDIPLMEDVAMSRELGRRMKPSCLRARVTTSSRRWESQGILRTIVLMWRLRWSYARGADPVQLARFYRL